MSMYKLSFLLILAYIVLLGRPLEREYSLEPGWVSDLRGEGAVSTSEPDGVPFRFSGHFGYFSPQKAVIFHDNILYGTALDRQGFINYSSINSALVLQSPEGMVSGRLEVTGYPYFTSGRRFILNSDGTALSEMNQEGAILWTFRFSSMITDVSASRTSVAVGTLNSGIRMLDTSGTEIFSYKPDFGKINTVYGTALNSDDSSILVISGLEPQKLLLFSKKSSGYRIVYSRNLENEYRFQRQCGFSSDGSFAYFDNGSYLSVLNTVRRQIKEFPVGGTLQHAVIPGLHDLVFTSARIGDVISFSGFDFNGERIFNYTSRGRDSFLTRDTSGIYSGAGEYLFKLDMVKR